MRRVIFNLALLLLVVVLVASLGAPGATASTPPVTSTAVSQVTPEHSFAKRSVDSNRLRGGTLFEAWPWLGANTATASAPRSGGDVGRLGHGSAY